NGERTFFQFSFEKTWEVKLRRELEKVDRYRHEIDAFTFITTQRVSGSKRDALASYVKDRFGWALTIYDREWLRPQLEEVHPHLARKYFGIEVVAPETVEISVEQISFKGPKAARKFYEQGEFDAAVVELRRWLEKHPADGNAWSNLAWCEYQQH